MRPRIPFPAPEATLARVRVLLISLPNWAIAAIMLAFFCAVSYATRALVLRFFGDDDREDLADQAKGLLTGVAATFAFFVDFAINISWGAVTAGQIAVEQQAAAIQQTAWELDNVTDRAQAAALMDKLRAYATTAAGADSDFLRRGNTTDLPSAVPLNAFEDAVRAYAYGPQAAGQQGTALVSAATSIRTSAASVAAVANRRGVVLEAVADLHLVSDSGDFDDGRGGPRLPVRTANRRQPGRAAGGGGGAVRALMPIRSRAGSVRHTGPGGRRWSRTRTAAR